MPLPLPYPAQHIQLKGIKRAKDMELNPEQKNAVEYDKGPCLIIAGAGTGKTMVITHRIAYLIASKKIKPERIIALTFTDKAAREMEERVDILVPYGYTDVQISTFHSFGDMVLREEGLEIGLTTDLKVLTRPEQIIFFREHLFKFPLNYFRPLGNPTKYIEAMLTLISRAKDEDITPDEYIAYAGKLKEEAERYPDDKELVCQASREMEIACTCKIYQELMAAEGFIDFGDQVNLVLRLFRERPAVLKRYQERFSHILVDEFQDTNYAQFQLLRLLTPPLVKGGRGDFENNITAVGDDDQSIYKFRGAAISNILNFRRFYPDARVIVLKENYRSSKVILDSAYRLIRFNDPERLEVKEKITKRMNARETGSLSDVRHIHFDTVSSEADGMAGMIEEGIKNKGYNYKDFAILIRSNNGADPYLCSLNMKGIPYHFTGNKGLYNCPEIRTLLSFLNIMGDIHKSTSLYELAASEIYQLGMADMAEVISLSKHNKKSIYYILRNINKFSELKEISDEGMATIKKIMDDIDRYLELSRNSSTGTLLYNFIMETGYLNALSRDNIPDSDIKIRNIAKFFDIVRSIENIGTGTNVSESIRHINLLREVGDDPPVSEPDFDIDAVNVMTIHKAKGLEFAVVFMPGLIEMRFPSRNRRDQIELPKALIKEDVSSSDSIHIEEERRLFYVGCTRAKRELYLTSARDYGTGRARKTSRFVFEALNLSPSKIEIERASPIEEIKRSAPIPEETGWHLQPKPDNEILYISHYQIDDYLTCPLKFKYRHILNVPIFTHHAIVYGNAIHKAISEYLRRKTAGKGITVEEVIGIFEANWISEGFLSMEHEEKRLERGREVLKAFYIAEEKDGKIPLYIEKDFSFFFENNCIIGRWDRIDKEGEVVRIIDYKSSTVDNQKDADKKTKENSQLSIYSLAYKEKFGKMPEIVELHFLDSGIVGHSEKTEKNLDKTKEKIREAAKGIRARDFQANPTYIACRYCPYREICPYVEKKG